MSTNKSIVKSASIMGLGTVVSRILGFIRDIVIAKFFGTGASAQAFVVAFRIPNLLRDLVGEGATNSAFVPVFSEYLLNKKKEEFWHLVSIILNILLVGLSIITILGIWAAPLIVRIIAPGFKSDPAKLLLTIKLTRILFPYLIFIALTAYSMGVLFTFKSFLTPSLSPCLVNLSMIVSVLIASRGMMDPVLGLAIGVLIGGFLQMAIQIPPLFKKGFRPAFEKNFSHPGARQIGKLLLPRVFGSAIYQLNVFVDTICASLGNIVGEGAVAAIYYANRLIQFPMAVFGISLASAALPTMSEFVVSKNLEKLKQTLNFSLRGIFLIMLPSSAMLMALSNPIVKIFFQRGEFDSYSTAITSSALLFYALGLFAYAGVKILASCFYSLQDTLTPVKAAFLSLIVNIILNVALMYPLNVRGIALASAISASLNFCLLFSILKKRIGGFTNEFSSFFTRVLLSSFLMGIAVFYSWKISSVSLNDIARLVLVVCLGIVIFMVSAFLLKIKEINSLAIWILKKR